MKHTPEPWIITHAICSNCHDGTVGVTVHTDNGNYDSGKDCPDCHGKGSKLFIQGKTDSAYFSIAEVAGPSNLDRLDELQANAELIAAAPERDRLKEINAELLKALEGLNHMGGDERGGYCICPVNDGSASPARHSTACRDARAAINKATQQQTHNHGRLTL